MTAQSLEAHTDPTVRITAGLLRLKREGVLAGVWIDRGRITVSLAGGDPLPFGISSALAELAIAAPTAGHAKAALLTGRRPRLLHRGSQRQPQPPELRREAYLKRAGRSEVIQ